MTDHTSLDSYDSDELITELERRGVLDPGHIVDVRDHDFAVQHPTRCRPDLFGCDVHQALTALDGRPVPVGRYRVSLVPGRLGLTYAPVR